MSKRLKRRIAVELADWKRWTGFLLIGIPFLYFTVLLTIGYAYATFMVITDQPLPRGCSERYFSPRVETRIVGDEYFLRGRESNRFRKVEKSDFHRAVEYDNLCVRRAYMVFIPFLMIGTGLFILKHCNHPVTLLPPENPEAMQALKALAKQRGIEA